MEHAVASVLPWGVPTNDSLAPTARLPSVELQHLHREISMHSKLDALGSLVTGILQAVVCSLIAFVAVILFPLAAVAADSPPIEQAQPTIAAPTIIRQALDPQIASWRARMIGRRNANPGCYRAHYPDENWTVVPCKETKVMNKVPPTLRTHESATRPRPEIVGNGNDYMALTSSHTTSATGEIIEIDNLTSESDSGLGAGKYSLQMNTNGFSPPSSICASCTGAVQFYYDQNGGGIFVQYWMLNYLTSSVTSCPSGWQTSGSACFKNGSACNDSTKKQVAAAPIVPLADLPQVSIVGQAVAGGNDTVTLSYGRDIVQQSACDNILSLNGNWTATEFNVLGDFNGDVASFNNGVVATIDITLTDTTADFPSCTTVSASSSSTTVESTNMDLAGCTATQSGIRFVEGVRPHINTIRPTGGSEDGGTPVEILGEANGGFSPSMQASFGGILVGATCSGNNCSVYPPRGTGTVPVAIENLTSVGEPGPPSTEVINYSYLPYPYGLLSPNQGSPAGGTKVALNGHNLGTAPGGTTISFSFETGAVQIGNVDCSNTAASGEFTQSCAFTTPPLPNPPEFGSTVVPVTITANGYTSGVGGFNYDGPTPPPPTCEDCIEEGERCVISRGHPICECERSSPHGVCE